MAAYRRLAVGLLVAAIVIGGMRGGVTTWLFDLSARAGVLFTARQITSALVWLPVGISGLATFRSRSRGRTRWGLIFLTGACVVCIEPSLMPLLGIPGPASYLTRFVNRLDTNVLFFIATMGAAAAVAARARQIDSEMAAARLELAVADAQLHVLALQLHPHFLFNALNLVSQLAYESVEAARETISNLRWLLLESLRHALHREVSLAEELRLLRAYLGIQEQRFRGRLFSRVSVDAEAESAAVPHFLLQPFVENAIAHGLSKRSEAGHIEIGASRTDKRLILTVRDDGEGPPSIVREGVGLSNTRLRLEQLFAGDYRLELGSAPLGGTITTVEIPYRRAERDGTSMSQDAFAPASNEAVQEARAVNRSRVDGGFWPVVIAGWTGLALLWTAIRSRGAAPSDPGWLTLATSHGINAMLWICFTPLIVRFARRSRMTARAWTKRFIMTHALAAFVVGPIHAGLWIASLWFIGSPDLMPTIRSGFGWMIWDAGAYIAIVSLTVVVTLTAQVRDIGITLARRRARLAEARLAGLRLRLQPRVLVGALDALERVISLDAERSEMAITRMGDLLRLLLARSEREWVEVDEERDLLAAYLDVVNAWREGERRGAISVADRCVHEQIPAMLLPALAAAVGGDLDDASIECVETTISITLRSRSGLLDEAALGEVSARLSHVYRGGDRLVCGKSEDGGRFIHVQIPFRVAERDHGYDEASA
jgi:signal transduction histidine kinase